MKISSNNRQHDRLHSALKEKHGNPGEIFTRCHSIEMNWRQASIILDNEFPLNKINPIFLKKKVTSFPVCIIYLQYVYIIYDDVQNNCKIYKKKILRKNTGQTPKCLAVSVIYIYM